MFSEKNADKIERLWECHHGGAPGAFHDLVAFAWEWLYKRVAGRLRGYPSVRLEADEVLLDHLQDRLAAALDKLKPQSCQHFTRLIDKHIRLALHDVIRAQKRKDAREFSTDDRETALEAPDSADGRLTDPLDELIDQQERARFHEAAAALPEPLAQAFCLRFYGGLSVEETAERMGVTEKSVRNYWQKAVDELSLALTGAPFKGPLVVLRRQGEAPVGEPCPPCRDG
jgi:RNA polymerase sigma factor (sigma-70 family)